MLSHTVFADCAALCAPPTNVTKSADGVATDDGGSLTELFTAMSYGIYPFCVQEDAGGTALLFRRVATPSDPKDRARRLTEAVEALHALPAVQRYHAGLDNSNDELHVQAGGGGATLSVSWPIALPPSTHADVVPDLLRWTQWARAALRNGGWWLFWCGRRAA